MTASRPSLILLSCSFVLQIANQMNGEITPPWTTYRGCYNWIPGSRNKSLSDNSPTNCFKECGDVMHIGFQADICVCLENMPKTPRRHDSMCQMGQLMFLYSKVIVLPFNISQADYGYVYVSIQSISSSPIYHASIHPAVNHGLLCTEDYSWNCVFLRGAANHVSGEQANRTCSLVSYLDFDKCPLAVGEYWIGMFRETPVFSSTTQVAPSTSTSPPLSSSTLQLFTDNKSPTFTVIISTLKPFPDNTSPTFTSSASLITDVKPSLQTRNPTSPKGKPEDTWQIIAIAFIVISVAFTTFIIAGIVAFLRQKKENHISHADVETTASTYNKKNEPASIDGGNQHLNTDKHPEIEGNHILEKHASPMLLSTTPDTKRKHKESHHQEETDGINLSNTIVGQDPERPKKKRKHKTSHHPENTDIANLSDTAVEHNLLVNVEHKKKKKKKKKKRKSKKRKRKHDNSDASDGINVS